MPVLGAASQIFQLEYPVTRAFPYKWLGLISYSAAFICVVFLAAINVALVGYDTVSTFTDAVAPQKSQWFDKLLPTNTPASHCDKALYRPGDTFRTNASLFGWRIESSSTPDFATGQALKYYGEKLEGCGLYLILVNVGLDNAQTDLTFGAKCNIVGGVMTLIRATFSTTWLYGKSGAYFDEIVKFGDSANTGAVGYRRYVATVMGIVLATADLYDEVERQADLNRTTAPKIVSVGIDVPYCPATSANVTCLEGVPRFNTSRVSLLYANNTSTKKGSSADIEAYMPMISNLAQTIIAVIKLDFGNNHSNNFLLDQSAINSTLVTSFSPYGNTTRTIPRLLNFLRNPLALRQDVGSDIFPLSSNFGPSIIYSAYLCRYQQLKRTGTLLVSVFVATSSMITGGWAFYLLLVAWWFKIRHGPEWNCCEHGLQGCPNSKDSSSVVHSENYPEQPMQQKKSNEQDTANGEMA